MMTLLIQLVLVLMMLMVLVARIILLLMLKCGIAKRGCRRGGGGHAMVSAVAPIKSKTTLFKSTHDLTSGFGRYE